MTDLSNILSECGDTVFKVKFRKQLDPQLVHDKLKEIEFKDINKSDTLKKISKDLIEGESCEIVGHLIQSDNNFGRSMVIDLNAPVYNNIRSVDHRSIDFIIFKNVKYQLGKKAPGTDSDQLPIKHDFSKPRWNQSKLQVGNIFSQITYYQV
jgi:hypothetical protein